VIYEEKDTTLFWLRRDLRLHDNHGLYKALNEQGNVRVVFIFDKHILDKLEDSFDKRLIFIHEQLAGINEELKKHGSALFTWYGYPEDFFAGVNVKAVYTNRDYEPYARERDQKVSEILSGRGIGFHTAKDHVVFEKDEVLKADGTPYTVYTPYSRKWKERFKEQGIDSYPSQKFLDRLLKTESEKLIPLKEMGFEEGDVDFPSSNIDKDIIREYADNRNFPSLRGTTRLSVHLRFGTVSIRELVSTASGLSDSWLNELIWRDFYQMILWHFPDVVNHSFKAAYDQIEWRNNEKEFEAWCEGKTGYPIVDAGMRELNASGFMHNRVRMITASFLTKHLLIDWRWGEAYFAKKLLDYELASNNGGWQWAAGSGCDAAPYFRVFNPDLQTKKFDPDLKYIRKWVPEFQELTYPKPIVEHKMARERALETFKAGLNRG
jgi:deoxyribodipyrimidine photo-lyase